MDNKFYEAVCFLDREIRNVLLKIEKNIAENVSEIRLRCERPVALTLFDGRSVYLKENGTVTERPFENTFVCSFFMLEKCFLSLCNFSVYSHTEEIREGFIPLKGGHRAGIAGKVVCDGETVRTITDISSINLRVAHEIKGAAMCISDVFLGGGGVLIAGPPLCGKTTVLRDAVRLISDGGFGRPKRVLLVDERGEISAMYKGRTYCDVGVNTDVLFGAPKNLCEMGIRSLSPEYIAFDEISESSAGQLMFALNSGVAAVATAHARTPGQLMKKNGIRELLENGVFESVAFFSAPGRLLQKNSVKELLL